MDFLQMRVVDIVLYFAALIYDWLIYLWIEFGEFCSLYLFKDDSVISIITNCVILVVTIYTFWLTHLAKKFNSTSILFGEHVRKGFKFSCFLMNKTLRGIAIKEIYVLSEVGGRCYSFLIEKYSTPKVLKPWEGIMVEQQYFSEILGFDDPCVLNKNSVILVKDFENIEIIVKDKKTKKQQYKFFKQCLATAQCSGPILVIERFYGQPISKLCQFGVIVGVENDNMEIKQLNLTVFKSGDIYDGDKQIAKIDIGNKEILTLEKVKNYIKEMYSVDDNYLIVDYIEKMPGFFQNNIVSNAVDPQIWMKVHGKKIFGK